MESCSTRPGHSLHVALHDYATEIFGSRSTLRVLRTLVHYRGKIFTIRELARISGLSHPETSKIVKELENRGVLKLQTIGRAYQVSLNEESYALKSIVEPMFKAEERTPSAVIFAIKPFSTTRG